MAYRALCRSIFTSYVIPRSTPRIVFSNRSFCADATPKSLGNLPAKSWLRNLPPGCDFEHWALLMDYPDGNPSREEIIENYIKMVAKVVGSEDEARKRIYSLSTKHHFGFGFQVSEELSEKLKELPKVLSNLYLDVENKDYGGEPFVNGKALPYDPKYDKGWNGLCREKKIEKCCTATHLSRRYAERAASQSLTEKRNV